MAQVQRVIESIGSDGKTVLSNLLNSAGKALTFKEITTYYDGSAMNDSKLFGEIYIKYKGKYFLQELGTYGQVLEKDTMESMRALSATELFLLKINYYTHIQLNGYYEKGDTPRSIKYYYDQESIVDDNGGSIVEVDVTTEGRFIHDFNGIIHVSYFGAKGDGILNNFYIFRTLSASLKDGDEVNFDGKGNYFLSHEEGYAGNPSAGLNAFNTTYNHLAINGMGCTISCIEHDLNQYTGLMMFSLRGGVNDSIMGFNFDMSFKGRNNSVSYYPRCGAIIGYNSTARPDGDITSEGLLNDFTVEGCSFKLYHPEGCYGEAANPTPSDPNNGFKIFSCYVHGDNTSTQKQFQNKGFTFRNNTFLKGHNAYGVWMWAFNSVTVNGNRAYDWANFATRANGSMIGLSYIPMVRYTQWYCEGFNVYDNSMFARPAAERVGGYRGIACFIHATNSLVGAEITATNGSTNMTNNVIVLDTSDLAGLFNQFGVLNVSGNLIRGNTFNVRPIELFFIYCYGEGGNAWYTFDNNQTDVNLQAPCFLRVENGGSTPETRRVKKLVAKNNICNNVFGMGILFGNRDSNTYSGVEKVFISNNICDATNTTWAPGNVNSAFIDAQTSNVATDTIMVRNNDVIGVYYLERVASTGNTPVVTVLDNYTTGVTNSSNWAYVTGDRNAPNTTVYDEGSIPLTGSSNINTYTTYWAKLIDKSTGEITDTQSGRAVGGTRVFGSTYIVPTGFKVIVDAIVIARKSSLSTS